MSAAAVPARRINSRAKGRRAQTEGRQLLDAAGWTAVDTSSGQAVEDIAAIDPHGNRFSVEVKAGTSGALAAHWRQADRQAAARGGGWRPLLLWRIDGCGWWLVVSSEVALGHTIEGRFNAWWESAPVLVPPASTALPTVVRRVVSWRARPLPIVHLGELVALPAADALEVW